jgi:NADH-quinone oxidoreductase subunit L
MAVVAQDLKRALAYSTISQLGYMVTAVGVGAVYASQFHLLSHAVFKALLFLGAGAVIHALGTRDMREMGGLARQMPFVRTVFVIGSLALAGIPVVNGFWSKELILEGALGSGSTWVFAGLVLGAGITALYTFRMVWLVFAESPRSSRHAHDAPAAMRVALSLLAIGTLTTWLLAGNLEQILEPALVHGSALNATLAICSEILTAPATLVALVVIALGLAAWWWRGSLAGIAGSLQGLARFAASGMGFEWINGRIVAVTQGAGEALRVTQTGELNWNVVGIAGALVVILFALFVRG